jgi:NADH:ubiquinone oxidoreductase subunit E
LDQRELRQLLRQAFSQERTNLLPVLHFVQLKLGHLPDWALQTVSWHLRIPASEVYGAATSYSELRIESPGDHLVRVCTGLPCWTNGARELLAHLSAHLGIRPGGTTAQGLKLEETPCGFLCPMAPVVEIDGHWKGRVSLSGLVADLEGLC